jgi:hypothetical protein
LSGRRNNRIHTCTFAADYPQFVVLPGLVGLRTLGHHKKRPHIIGGLLHAHYSCSLPHVHNYRDCIITQAVRGYNSRMKRLILIGGGPWLAGGDGKPFVDTLFQYHPNDVKVALCMFAQPESDWDETRRINAEMFTRHAGTRNLEIKTMTTENFTEVSAWADVIYLAGGSTSVLKEKLDNAGDLVKLWDEKVITGSSAGADMFCEGFIYLQDKTYGKGLGWIQATCIPHWRSDFEGYTKDDWDEVEQTALKQGLPVLCIPEGSFTEFTVQ